MVILGLTGSIGMGKTVAAAMFAREGAAVFDADAAVRCLTAPGGPALPAIGAAFPDCVRRGAEGLLLDRAALGQRVFANATDRERLEAILHPLVREREKSFLRRAAAAGKCLVVLDIPLLFETGGERRCDVVAVVSAPAFVQARRVLARPGMTRNRLAAIVARQMPDAEKRRRANFVIPTGLGRAVTLRAVRRVVRRLARRRGRHWPPTDDHGRR